MLKMPGKFILVSLMLSLLMTACTTATPAPTPTAEPTATSIPPTATPVPSTATPEPTATRTPLPPTKTATPVPPTNTPAPTKTSTPVPTKVAIVTPHATIAPKPTTGAPVSPASSVSSAPSTLFKSISEARQATQDLIGAIDQMLNNRQAVELCTPARTMLESLLAAPAYDVSGQSAEAQQAYALYRQSLEIVNSTATTIRSCGGGGSTTGFG